MNACVTQLQVFSWIQQQDYVIALIKPVLPKLPSIAEMELKQQINNAIMGTR
jgi:hypothetical protein